MPRQAGPAGDILTCVTNYDTNIGNKYKVCVKMEIFIANLVQNCYYVNRNKLWPSRSTVHALDTAEN